MSNSSEEISRSTANGGFRTDANLANDSLHLGGIPAEDYPTERYLQEYVERIRLALKEYFDTQDVTMLQQAKAYTDLMISTQDFTGFAKITDLQALSANIGIEIQRVESGQKSYTDGKVAAVVSDVNANFTDVGHSIESLNNLTQQLFQSVSSGKTKLAGAITGKGVPTSASDTFDTMATNIVRIPTDGSGQYDENFVNTADATATASDILNGKTAYVRGQKIYGDLIYTKENEYEVNPDNPYPVTAQVELVYGEKANQIDTEEIGSMNWYYVSNMPNIDITPDKRIMVEYNVEQSKIITYQNVAGKYRRVYDDDDQLITPEYSLNDLGIDLDLQHYRFASLKIGKMNDNEVRSGYETRIAICFQKHSATSETAPATVVYVYRMSSYNGEIKTENEQIQIGTTGNTSTNIYYNKWIIAYGGETSPGTNQSTMKLKWSPDSYSLAIMPISTNCVMYVYQFLDTTPGTTEDYDTATKMVFSDGVSSGYVYTYSFRDIDFLNQDRIIKVLEYVSYGSGKYITNIYIVDENFNILRSYVDGYNDNSNFQKTAYITNDGLYGVGPQGLHQLVVNYVTGELSTIKISDISIVLGEYGRTFFTKDNKYFITISPNSPYTIYVYTFNDERFELLHTYTPYSNSNFLILSDLEAVVYQSSSSFYSMLSTIKDQEELIGIKYQGQLYYSSIYKTGKFTAGQPDVKAGKTFIGYLGIPETGTMEVE